MGAFQDFSVNGLAIALVLMTLCVLSLFAWRFSDIRIERKVWSDLLRRAGRVGPAFDPAMVEGLPEPARRYFRYTIAPGTPLVSVVELAMAGQLGLGSKEDPRYRRMAADQLLAPPNGLVWRVRAGSISGSDGATPDGSWTRFWLMHLIPVVRVSADPNHRRSAFGRIVAEGAFWVPASLLPSDTVAWESAGEDTARAIVSCGDYRQAIDLSIDANGRPKRIVIQRWSNENADKAYREQPFGGDLSGFRETGGYRLPMRVEGGNLIGTEHYFPFFKAQIRTIRFPQLAPMSAERPRTSASASVS